MKIIKFKLAERTDYRLYGETLFESESLSEVKRKYIEYSSNRETPARDLIILKGTNQIYCYF